MSNQLKATYLRKFLSNTFNPLDEVELEQSYKELLEKDINTPESLENFLEHWSELGAIIDEAGSLAYVNMTCNTKDEQADQNYKYVVEKIYPICQIYEDKVQEKFLSSPALGEIDQNYYGLFIKETKNQKELFRKENVELFTKDALLSQEYQKITGAWMVEFEGKKYTVQQMQVFQEHSDRNLRERAYKARVEVHLKDADKLDDLFDKMLEVRQQIARNAGFKNFRDYKFKANNRFDYTPEDCLEFHEAIAQTIVPLLTEWNKEKCKKLNISTIRPWDLYVDPESNGIIKAFETEDEFIAKLQNVFNTLHPTLGEYFTYMKENKLLDLTSREGKAPGGYMTELNERRVPFIFMNAVGTKRDVETLLHESGHAFHAFEARDQKLKAYRSSPLEFAEVASMSMELLGRPYYHYIYKEEDIKKVKKEQLIKIVEFFPFMSMIDSFQHWVYTTQENDRIARGKKWQELNKKFQPYLDMSGLERIEQTRWQYPHVFTVPFYYIEYGIAQVGALQVWRNSLQNEKQAISMYLKGLSKGGSLPLPKLFEASGIQFSMKKEILQELVSLIEQEVNKN